MSDLKSKLMKLCATRFQMSTQDYVDKILKLIEEALPVEQKLPKKFTKGELAILAECVGGHIWKTGFNACLSEMRRKK